MKRSFLAIPVAVMIATFPHVLHAQQGSRDFEKRGSERLLAQARTPSDRFAAELELGDLHYRDGRRGQAVEYWQRARRTAAGERARLYAAGEMSQWARFTAWEAVVAGLLGDRKSMRSMFERAMEILPGDHVLWSRYAGSELSAGDAAKAVLLARVALAHAPSPGSDAALLDRAVVEFTLARALRAAGEIEPAIATLETLSETLQGPAGATLRQRAAREEGFAVRDTARGSVEAFTSLAVRTHTLLAELHEENENRTAALAAAGEALEVRSDHPPALAVIARLGAAPSGWRDAFASDPLDRDLHRRYRNALQGGMEPLGASGSSAADLVLTALAAMHREQWSSATAAVEKLEAQYETSEPLRSLRAELLARQGRIEEARALATTIGSERIRNTIPISRVRTAAVDLPSDGTLVNETDLAHIEALLRDPMRTDTATAMLETRSYDVLVLLVSPAVIETETLASEADAGSRRLRFPATVRFRGDWSAPSPLLLRFKVLAVDVDGLLIEPEGLRAP